MTEEHEHAAQFPICPDRAVPTTLADEYRISEPARLAWLSNLDKHRLAPG